MRAILFLACMLSAVAAFPQNEQDSVAKKAKDGNGAMKGLSVSELFAVGEKTFGGSGDYGSFRNFKGHWKGYYIGFMNLVNLPDGMEDLEVKRGGSFNMQFNFVNYSINLNKRGNFGLQTGLGLEYQRFRFDNPDVTLAKIDGKVVPASTAFEGNDHTVRSVFKNFYLTVPMLAEVQFPADKKASKQCYIAGGFIGGIRMHSKAKVVYEDSDGDKQKEKAKGNFNVVPFKVDATVRVGCKHIAVWGSYALTNLFKGNSIPDVHVFTVGFGVTI